MARGDTYTCRTCGKIYNYCEKCAITPEPHKGNGFCSKEHLDIFAILSKHGCNLATAEETLEALKDYNTTNVTEGIQAHIDGLKSEVVKPEPASNVVEAVEETVVKTVFDKNNKKKKW